MTSSDEESTTYSAPSEKKKKKQKHSDKSIVKESDHHKNENTTKKKPKKKTNAKEEDSEKMDVIPKKRTNLDISSGESTSGEIQKKKKKKKKKKKVLDIESSACDPQTIDDVLKKKAAEHATSCEQGSTGPVHKEKEKHSALVDGKESVTKKKKKKNNDALNVRTANENVLKSKSVTEDRSINSKDPEDDMVNKQKKKEKKNILPSPHFSEDKDLTTDQATSKKDCFNSKVKKRKKAQNESEDEAPETEKAVTDGSVIQKKKKKVGSPKEDRPEVSDRAKVKKKKKRKGTFEKSEDEVIGHEVHHGKKVQDSLSVLKKKKTSKGFTVDEESGHRNTDLNGNGGKGSDHTSEGSLKKKKGSKSQEVTEFMDSKEESSHEACEEEKKKVKKRKREEMLRHTDKEHSANEDATEVSKKKQKIKDETKNTNKATKLQGTKFGQWDTATFQNSEQQSKFFRLLGGLKKGNQVAVPSPSNQVKANMAMGKQEEQSLERNLLQEFDKAVSWRQNRGIGLGFQPAQNKTYYIDKTASRSVKFED
ncbi:lysine-rich nucleolar protein 1 isoform X2 [Hyla sarda]|uniref:lysine-rich nucleolar protein 1 isoform X2 n=1 Tax=Hyla sarda TaxID=327740 RepID=UPI0024C240B0|nr:lysine-rich nucleolar protein 1 isoform X2 [Hyla sarda]